MDRIESFLIGKQTIGKDSPCFVIAEAGSNHNRDYNLALKLIEAAADARADAVKFQVFSADKIAANTTDIIASLNGDKFSKYGKTLYDLYKNLELPRKWLPKLKKHAEDCGIMFSATPFDEEAVDELETIKIEFYKIASFELVHIPLISYAARTQKPIIVSTGMATLDDISDAVKAITKTGNNNYALLHCGIEYPPRMEDIHLAAMDKMHEVFSCPVGYSDHSLGLTVPIAAVARGAKIIEKHFTLDKTLNGPDHKFALSPKELKDMVTAIRETELAIGKSDKMPVQAELIYLKRGRRSLFAKCEIKKGEVITKDMISILRPASGIMPKYFDEIIGKKVKSTIPKNEPITWELIE
jgi:pseudaminic acid synthase